MDSIAQYLADHRFAELFRDELGWDRSSGSMDFSFGEKQLHFEAIAQKRGLQVLLCTADRRVLFNRALLRKARRRIARAINEHILIFACNEPPKQVWQWAVRLPGSQRLRYREHVFFSMVPPAAFVNRLESLRFSLDAEADVTLVDVLERVRTTLDAPAELDLFAKRYAKRSDELAVAMRNGDAGAFDDLIILHRPLARQLSTRWLHRWPGFDADDGEQIGVIGLIEAARRFDPKKGCQFSTYATYWVRQACQRLGLSAALFIRLPYENIQPLVAYRRYLERLTIEHGPARAKEELSRRCMAEKSFRQQWQGFERAVRIRSLSNRADSEYRQARRLAAPTLIPLEQQLRDDQTAIVRAALESMRPRDQRFIRLRHGIDCEPHTLAAIGKGENITREAVRQALKKAEGRLRRRLCRVMDVRDPLASVPTTQVEPDVAENGATSGS